MTQEQKQKISTAVISTIFLLLVFLFMAVSKVPKSNIDEVIAKIDVDMLTKFEPKKIEIKKPEPEEKPEKMEKEEEPKPEEVIEEEPEPVDVQPDQPVERVELDMDIFNQLNAGEMQTQTQTIEAPGRAASTPDLPAIQVNQRTSNVDLSGPTLTDDQSTLTALSRKNNASNMKVEAGTVRDSKAGLTSYGTEGGAAVQGRQTLGASAGPKVSMVDKATLRKSKVELINLSALVKWMKAHPAEFKRVIKGFVEYKAGALTSHAPFKINGRRFDLYIMCFEATSEVRIALIEGEQVIRLIDQGFTGANEQFLIGTVTRVGKKILGFNTSQKSIGDEQSSEFNQIFVSWWESVKHEVK